MVVPKKSDKLMKQKMALDKIEHKVYTSSEDSEFHALDWDFKKGIKLLPHKMEKYLELKKKLGK